MDTQLRITEIINTYKPSDDTVQLVRDTQIVLLVGISGAGKDTIKRHLLESGEYHHIVSHTTRPPRSNGGVLEQDGRDYHFITHQEALHMLEAGSYVEAKQYGLNIYGTSAAEIRLAHDEHRIAVTDVEVQGVAEYKLISKNVIAVFVVPPNYDEWQRRLVARYGDSKNIDKKDMYSRMETAVEELEAALAQPYYHFVINDSLDTAVGIVDKIAHNHDEFNTVDDAVRNIARDLAADLRQKIYESTM